MVNVADTKFKARESQSNWKLLMVCQENVQVTVVQAEKRVFIH